MQYTIKLDIPDDIKQWILAELQLFNLFNEIDAAEKAGDDEKVAELDSLAAPLANTVTEMGFINEDAFRFVLKIAEALEVETSEAGLGQTTVPPVVETVES